MSRVTYEVQIKHDRFHLKTVRGDEHYIHQFLARQIEPYACLITGSDGHVEEINRGLPDVAFISCPSPLEGHRPGISMYGGSSIEQTGRKHTSGQPDRIVARALMYEGAKGYHKAWR